MFPTRSDPTRISIHRSGGDQPEQALIYLPGIANDGDLTINRLLPFLLRYGTVIVANYPTHGFDPDETVAQVVAQASGYESVVLLASSMGGLLVDRIVREIERREPGIIVKVVGCCALASGEGAALPAAILAHLCYWPLASRPIISVSDWLVGLHDALPIEQAVREERRLLKAHRRALRGVPASARRAQLRFIATAELPKTCHDIECVYIQARQVDGKSDGFVLGSAVDAWKCVYPRAAQLHFDNLRHCTWVEQPKAWQRALQLAFACLGVRPVGQ